MQLNNSRIVSSRSPSLPRVNLYTDSDKVLK